MTEIKLPKVSCHEPHGADYYDNHRQGGIKGYFISVEQALVILESARFRHHNGSASAVACDRIIAILTGSEKE